jgi:diaminopimelate decarboxylase
VRVNPQVGTGSIEATSTAGPTSKFGVPLQDPASRVELVNAFVNRPWLRWVHVHVGSQGIPPELAARGVAAAVALAEDVEHVRPGQIAGIDVGGGVTVDYGSDDTPRGFAEHVAALRKAAPALFGGRYRIITEFGRSLLAKSGFIASYVEYTKTAGGRRIALTHAGAQVATRTVYTPEEWPLRILAYDDRGRPSTANAELQDVAGPCCFAGDLLAEARTLPRLESGDLVVVPDTGAYYFSTPYGYNSLPEPPVYGFQTAPDGTVAFSVLRAAETIAEVVARADRSGGVRLT